jgi:hypothetical protein
MSRTSSPLLFGLAPRGVFRALAIAGQAVGSYSTFSPLPAVPAVRDVSQVSLRDATVLRSTGGLIFCGTIRGCALRRSPLALPGALSCREFWPTCVGHASGRCPDFPPVTALCSVATSDCPARPLPIIITVKLGHPRLYRLEVLLRWPVTLDRSHRSAARLPLLAKLPYGLAHAHRQRRDGLDPFKSATRQTPVVNPRNFRQQQFRVA